MTTPSPPSPAVDPLPPFASAAALMREAADLLRPPQRMSVSDAAERYRHLHNPGGGYSGPWRRTQVPMMVKPMDTLESRKYQGLIFVGPAQSTKTDSLVINWIVKRIKCNPADMLVVNPTELAARDFSKRRIDRMNEHCPAVGRLLGNRRTDDNVRDKSYPGMMLSLGWPTIAHLSGRPIPLVIFTDYDRMPQNIDGEGAPFDLGVARTRTFQSAGMTAAESSPGREVTDPDWEPETPHEAPPTTGTLALYNRGDRRLWYVPCPDCGEFFAGSFADLVFDDALPPAEAAADVMMRCPHCGVLIDERHKPAMNAAGVWLKEGQTISADGVVTGEGRKSHIASFWLKGPWAIFQRWGDLVQKYLTAQAERQITGDEEALRTTINVDQAEPYLPLARQNKDGLKKSDLVARAESYPLGIVPEGARFLTAAIDVQANRFPVQVEAWGVDRENWLIDRFDINQSARRDREGRPATLRPAVHDEDWLLITDQVLDRVYPLAGDPARGMRIQLVVCDSHGAAGVTDKAYAYWRLLKRGGKGNRLRLLRGIATPRAPRVIETFPDTNRKDRMANARGEIPVLQLQVNRLKDEVDADLRNDIVGPRYQHLPDALDDSIFDEFTAEQREDEIWVRKPGRANEAFDLKVYNRAAMIILGTEKIRDFDSGPAWVRPWAENANVVKLERDGGRTVVVEDDVESRIAEAVKGIA